MKRIHAVLVVVVAMLVLGGSSAPATATVGEGGIDKPTVLVFGLGSRCRYCVQLKKDIGKVTETTGEAVVFQHILVNEDLVMARQYRVILSPTLIFLNADGDEVFRHQGILDSDQIYAKLVELKFWSERG